MNNSILSSIAILVVCVFCMLIAGCTSKVECPLCGGGKEIVFSNGQTEMCKYCDEDGMMTKEKAEKVQEVLNIINNHGNSGQDDYAKPRQQTVRGNCGGCNGSGFIQTGSGKQVCAICGGDGDFSLDDGNRIMNSGHSSSADEDKNNSGDNGLSPHNVKCTLCKGTGYCSKCMGAGVIFTTEYAANSYVECPSCKGNKRCRSCGGTGVSHVEYR